MFHPSFDECCLGFLRREKECELNDLHNLIIDYWYREYVDMDWLEVIGGVDNIEVSHETTTGTTRRRTPQRRMRSYLWICTHTRNSKPNWSV